MIVIKITYYFPSLASSVPNIDYWPFVVFTQLIQFLSLISACILYIRPFLEALTSGFINGDDLRRRGQITPWLLADSGFEVTTVSTQQSSRPRGRARRRFFDTSGPSHTSRKYNSVLRDSGDMGEEAGPEESNLQWPLPARRLSQYNRGAGEESASTDAKHTPSSSNAPLRTEQSRSLQTPDTQQSSPVILHGSETRRLELEQTQKGNYPITSKTPQLPEFVGDQTLHARYNEAVGSLGWPARKTENQGEAYEMKQDSGDNPRREPNTEPDSAVQLQDETFPAPQGPPPTQSEQNTAPATSSNTWLRTFLRGTRATTSHQSGGKARRQTAASSVDAGNNAERATESRASDVAPLPTPRPRKIDIPLGTNNLPRVSTVYTPLEENAEIAGYIAPSRQSKVVDQRSSDIGDATAALAESALPTGAGTSAD